MKKKFLILFFVVAIIVNVFLSARPTATRGKKFDLALVQLEARADGPEIDPPVIKPPPTRIQLNGYFLQSLDSSLVEAK